MMRIPSFCKFVKIITFVPLSYASKAREALAHAGAGKLGAYDFCSFSSRGTGRFRPGKKAHPFIGKKGRLVSAQEERIEVLCSKKNIKKAVGALIKAHPYDEPAIEIYPLAYP